MFTYPAPNPLCGDTLAVEIATAVAVPPEQIGVVLNGTNVVVTGTPATATSTQVGAVVAAHTGVLPVAVQNGLTLRQRALNALTANATYLAIATPTTAQMRDQLAVVTKECNGLIRLLLNQLDSTSGT